MQFKMDTTYWWHNLLLIDPHRIHFHYPFQARYGDAPTFIMDLVRTYVGSCVLDLGCGTGWLRQAWKIANYTGVDINRFSELFQRHAREQQMINGVVHTDLAALIKSCQQIFDTIVCYESFHAFPNQALEIMCSPLLRSGGTVIIVDAEQWWPSEITVPRFDFKTLLKFEIPTHWFELEGLARVSLDLIDALETRGVSRDKILAIARENLQPEICCAFQAGATSDTVRSQLLEFSLFPVDLKYTVTVLEKS